LEHKTSLMHSNNDERPVRSPLDLTNCDKEPIHIPGSIQPHGFLVVVDVECLIRFISDNIQSYLRGASSELLGKPVQDFESLFDHSYEKDFIVQLVSSGMGNAGVERGNPYQVAIDGVDFLLIVSTAGEYYLLEFEPTRSDIYLDVQKLINHSIGDLLADKTLESLVKNTAFQVKSITGYDRVMIYRFEENGDGDVVAEARNDNLSSWLGLRYPASDIPKQARELYKKNLTRLIANVNSTTARILTEHANTTPLDLTFSQLRAVSPVHIQYLKNMGVMASFSISIIYKNELWGLIVCHNYTPKFIEFKSRESSKLIGQILSSALEYRQNTENKQVLDLYKASLEKISKSLYEHESMEEALMRGPVSVLDVVQATGVVLRYEKKTVKLGSTPAEEDIERLIAWLKDHNNEAVYCTSKLGDVFEEAKPYQLIASGMLTLVLSKELEEYIIWFKPEIKQTINWAGNPNKPLEVSEDGLLNLSPRKSFDVWSESVSGCSEGWAAEEITSVLNLKEEIFYTINQKAGAMRVLNEKLKSAYEELDTFSYTISHDLKNPISAIKSYAQILARETPGGEQGQKILDRIEDQADKMNFMINEVLDYSRIGRSELEYRPINTRSMVQDIIKDLDEVYDTKNLKITLGEMPQLKGDSMMMLQVFSNLISNAVKYSQLVNPALVHIEGNNTGTDIVYTITDNGLGIAAKDLLKIFELFNRMDNVKDIQGSGVGLGIVKRIVERHKGKIWAESELGKGTTFFMTFNKS